MRIFYTILARWAKALTNSPFCGIMNSQFLTQFRVGYLLGYVLWKCQERPKMGTTEEVMRNIALFVVLVVVVCFVGCGKEDASPQRRIVKMVEDVKTPINTVAATTERVIEYDRPLLPANDPEGGVRVECKKVGNSVTCYLAVTEGNECQLVEVSNRGDHMIHARPHQRFVAKVVCDAHGSMR